MKIFHRLYPALPGWESHHDSTTMGDKLNVDHIFNNDGKSEMILENNMRLKDSIDSTIISYHLVY